MNLGPFCTYYTILTFRLGRLREKYGYENLAKSRPSTKNKSYTVLSTLQNSSLNKINDQFLDYNSTFSAS